MTTALRSFHNMHYRVRKSPSYSGVAICEEWHEYKQFKAFFDANYREGSELDKDLLGGKLYGPETCVFIPKRLNLLFRKSSRKLPLGVYSVKGKYRALCSNKDGKLRYLGTFPTKEKAQRVYGAYKAAIVWDIATAYYNAGKISRKVYEAIITRKTIFY